MIPYLLIFIGTTILFVSHTYISANPFLNSAECSRMYKEDKKKFWLGRSTSMLGYICIFYSFIHF